MAKRRRRGIHIIIILRTDSAGVERCTMRTKRRERCFSVLVWRLRRMAVVARTGGIPSALSGWDGSGVRR